MPKQKPSAKTIISTIFWGERPPSYALFGVWVAALVMMIGLEIVAGTRGSFVLFLAHNAILTLAVMEAARIGRYKAFLNLQWQIQKWALVNILTLTFGFFAASFDQSYVYIVAEVSIVLAALSIGLKKQNSGNKPEHVAYSVEDVAEHRKRVSIADFFFTGAFMMLAFAMFVNFHNSGILGAFFVLIFGVALAFARLAFPLSSEVDELGTQQSAELFSMISRHKHLQEVFLKDAKIGNPILARDYMYAKMWIAKPRKYEDPNSGG